MNPNDDDQDYADAIRDFKQFCSTNPPMISLVPPQRFTVLEPDGPARIASTAWARADSDKFVDPKMFAVSDACYAFLERHLRDFTVTTDGILFFALVMGLRGVLFTRPEPIQDSPAERWNQLAMAD